MPSCLFYSFERKVLINCPAHFELTPQVQSHRLGLLSRQHCGLVELGWTHSPNLHDTVPHSCQDLSNRNVGKRCLGVHMLRHHTGINVKQLWNPLSWSFAVSPSYWFLATAALATHTAQWGCHPPRAVSTSNWLEAQLSAYNNTNPGITCVSVYKLDIDCKMASIIRHIVYILTTYRRKKKHGRISYSL